VKLIFFYVLEAGLIVVNLMGNYCKTNIATADNNGTAINVGGDFKSQPYNMILCNQFCSSFLNTTTPPTFGNGLIEQHEQDCYSLMEFIKTIDMLSTDTYMLFDHKGNTIYTGCRIGNNSPVKRENIIFPHMNDFFSFINDHYCNGNELIASMKMSINKHQVAYATVSAMMTGIIFKVSISPVFSRGNFIGIVGRSMEYRSRQKVG